MKIEHADGSVTIERGRLPDNDDAPVTRLIVYSRYPGIITHMAPDLTCDADGPPTDCDGGSPPAVVEHVHDFRPFGYAVRQCSCGEQRPQPGFECRICGSIPENFEPCHTSTCDACRAKGHKPWPEYCR